MRVEPDFLQPLLDGFTDERVFAVSCQIFFSDPNKLREETGLTEVWWERGSLRVRHRTEPEIRELYPCFYGGGGSCAFDRRKFLELGGFDELLAPFYLEDTDLGYLAWKRGWKILYQPASVVFHEHRGTIGSRFSEAYIQGVLKKNFLLFAWKNIHEWRRLLAKFLLRLGRRAAELAGGRFSGAIQSCAASRARRCNCRALASRCAGTPARRRSRTRKLCGGRWAVTSATPSAAAIVATERRCACCSFRRIRFALRCTAAACSCTRRCANWRGCCELHLIVLLDSASQRRGARRTRSAFAHPPNTWFGRWDVPKLVGSIEPHAVREFRIPDLAWLIHRQIYTQRIDVVQLEYTVLGQYAGQFRRIPSILFEHDVYFQSIARRLPFMSQRRRSGSQARWEYLRALRYELRMLPKLDRIQVCSRDNADYLLSFLPQLKGRIDDGFRAGIDTSRYTYRPDGREPFTMLFLGSFRHTPNLEALTWFVEQVLPLVLAEEPRARVMVVGSDPPTRSAFRHAEAIELVGFVEDVREPLARYSLFVCPILSGSGVRVKLLEAFAAGIPVVSTRLGAEGLADRDGEICALADEPAEFARRVVDLLRDPQKAAEMAARAREEVVAKRDIRGMTERLVECYRAEVLRRNAAGYALLAFDGLAPI